MDAHRAILNFLLAAKKAEEGGTSLSIIANAAQNGIFDITDNEIIDIFIDATTAVEKLHVAVDPAQD